MSVTIIGAGVSGIAMAIKLKEIGVKFKIIEKEKKLGGTWWLNQYPGCECDIASHLYRYMSFFSCTFIAIVSSVSEYIRFEHNGTSHWIKAL